MKKRILIIPLIILFITSPINVLASENDNQEVKVVISPEAEGIPDYIVNQIIEESPDAGVITIYEYGELSGDEESKFIDNKPDTIIKPLALNPIGFHTKNGEIKTKKTITDSNHLAKDEFKFSVAKGESVTLDEEITCQLKGSIIGDYFDKSKIGAEITLTGKFSKGTTYTGPPEDSIYNSREYRMKFYEELGTYKQTVDVITYHYMTKISTETKTISGKYKKPTKYASYSNDKKIKTSK